MSDQIPAAWEETIDNLLAALPPADIVPHETDHDSLIALIRAEGRTVTEQSREYIYDDAGDVMAVVEAEPNTEATLTGVSLTSGEWESLARHLIEKDTK